jgi:hypothetical protein
MAQRATLDLLKVTGTAGKSIGVIVLRKDEQIRYGARRLLNLAKDVSVDRLVVASPREESHSLKSFLIAEGKPEASPDVPSVRLAVAALRQTRQWPARGTLSVDACGTRIECGANEPKARVKPPIKIWSIATLDEDLSHANRDARRVFFSTGGRQAMCR